MLTRDIGLAIRDFLEGKNISHFEDENGHLTEVEGAAQIYFVDVSDADNPIAHLDSGHTFQIRIFAA